MIRKFVGAWALMILLTCAFLTNASPAHAQYIGDRGTLAIDQVSGFRARLDPRSTLSYYGPIGLSYQNISTEQPQQQEAGNARTVYSLTTFWFAPSADYFFMDRVSLGGMIEFSTTSVSATATDSSNRTRAIAVPDTTNFTIIPRIGYVFPIGEKFGIWPRLGLGYTSRHFVTDIGVITGEEAYYGIIIDADASILFRPTDAVFLKLGPEMAYLPAAGHSIRPSPAGQNVTAVTDARVFQFTLVTGIGLFFEL